MMMMILINKWLMVVFVVDGGELVEAEILLPTKLSSSDDPNTPEVTTIGNSIADG